MDAVIDKEITGKQFNELGLKPVKILSSNLKHYDFQYQPGLNIDHNKFNPTGECKTGGLYFTFPKYLYRFLHLGESLFQVTIPDDARVYCEDKIKFKADKILINEIDVEDLDIVKDLEMDILAYIKLSEKPKLEVVKYLVGEAKYKEDPKAIRYAASGGHLEIVKYLVGEAKYKECPDAIRCASEEGHLEIVKYLVGEAKYKECPDAIRYTASGGHLEIVKYLVGEAKYKEDPKAIRYAASGGHLEIVKYLVGEAKYKEDPEAINYASRGGHLEIVKYLVEEAKYKEDFNAIVGASCTGHLEIKRYLQSKYNK